MVIDHRYFDTFRPREKANAVLLMQIILSSKNAFIPLIGIEALGRSCTALSDAEDQQTIRGGLKSTSQAYPYFVLSYRIQYKVDLDGETKNESGQTHVNPAREFDITVVVTVC